MYCKHCGREIGDDQRFCSYCGARQQENGPDQVPPQPDGTTATQTGNYRYDAPPPSGGAPVAGGNALLTIFAILCAVAYGVRAIGRFFGAVGVLLGGYCYGATVLTHVLLPMIQSGAYMCMCLLLLAMALKSTRENREAYFLGVSCLSLATLAVLAIRALMMVLIDGLVYGWHWSWGGFVTSVLGLAVTVGGLWVLMYLDGQRALVGKSADQLRQLGYDLSDAIKELRFTGNQNTSGQKTARPQDQSASANYGAGVNWTRPVTEDRNFVLYVVLTIITCGIYGLVFLYSMIQDVNTVCDGDGEHTRGLLGLILLSLVTCGIYSFYWYYCLGNRLANNASRYGMSFQENGTTVLLWLVIGSLLCGLGTWVATYIIIKNCNQLCAAYNRAHGI